MKVSPAEVNGFDVILTRRRSGGHLTAPRNRREKQGMMILCEVLSVVKLHEVPAARLATALRREFGWRGLKST